jgi:hypothetical protein
VTHCRDGQVEFFGSFAETTVSRHNLKRDNSFHWREISHLRQSPRKISMRVEGL